MNKKNHPIKWKEERRTESTKIIDKRGNQFKSWIRVSCVSITILSDEAIKYIMNRKRNDGYIAKKRGRIADIYKWFQRMITRSGAVHTNIQHNICAWSVLRTTIKEKSNNEKIRRKNGRNDESLELYITDVKQMLRCYGSESQQKATTIRIHRVKKNSRHNKNRRKKRRNDTTKRAERLEEQHAPELPRLCLSRGYPVSFVFFVTFFKLAVYNESSSISSLKRLNERERGKKHLYEMSTQLIAVNFKDASTSAFIWYKYIGKESHSIFLCIFFLNCK